ncbi:DUF2309 domain-containing protein [Rhodovulum sp. 12E13]|uniref:YbcC family protein n=1 Tax=Rhodovulum sp. 12E13 TaxID=2203891 RepID=UPI000E16EA68|nr:DUF2309 domain-containing protein [Rhodovulum sp. 12E13]RDC73996.1 DUF2309 domain-containing protein [Rhodovulum sp. 12E13]
MTNAPLSPAALMAAADGAGRAIPPVWPLASSVAVNPYLGQTGERLAVTGARLARVAGIPVAMPRDWYAERIADGRITDDDLAAALAAAPQDGRPADLAALRAAVASPARTPKALPTVADLAADASRLDWPGLIAERIGAWSGAYFDAGQALWAAPKRRGPWTEWRAVATHDLTPEIQGLTGFAAHVFDAPETAEGAIARAALTLGLSRPMLETYFHQLLMSMGGWAQFARYRLWQVELGGGADPIMAEMLAIRLTWEEALFRHYEDEIADEWARTRAAHEEPVAATDALIIDEILQEAAERAAQRDLAALFAAETPQAQEARPAVQAAFCIDVRSEVFRRALEAVDPGVETLGFAGFFGVATKHRGFASDVDELRLPVLLNPSVSTCSGGPDTAEEDQDARFAARAKRAWGRFKLAAVSSFAFVEAMGPVYAGKLVRDSLGLDAAGLPDGPPPRLDPALPLDARIGAAETVLRAMSLTENFARIVLLAGHGANVTNNPHASALHCGACGGYSGEVNARLLALLLSDPAVRAALPERGIEVPDDTLFLAGLHDTTTDAVKLYEADVDTAGHTADLKQLRAWLAAAGKVTRAERALRLPRAEGPGDIESRSRDWAEVRPEWALAGCKAFIAAPRSRTAGRSLEGRAFLHNYDWRADEGFGVLELIMTAPVVVASWISLQYYGSTVSPSVFGGGNKLLHNVTGGIGVVEGNGGLLRAGLPWQSVHDGESYAHEPLRLSVCIEAPREAMTDILSRHEGVRALFDNRWLHLFALDEAGQMAWRYAGGLEWEETAPQHAPADAPHLKAVS